MFYFSRRTADFFQNAFIWSNLYFRNGPLLPFPEANVKILVSVLQSKSCLGSFSIETLVGF